MVHGEYGNLILISINALLYYYNAGPIWQNCLMAEILINNDL